MDVSRIRTSTIGSVARERAVARIIPSVRGKMNTSTNLLIQKYLRGIYLRDILQDDNDLDSIQPRVNYLSAAQYGTGGAGP